MLSCKEVATRASALIDGELTTWETIQMRFHLAMCKGCARFVSQLRATRDLTRIAGSPQTLDEVDERRVTAILSTRRVGD